MATIIPISCKDGIVILSSNAHIFGKSWGAQLTIEKELYKHFEITDDANLLKWAQLLTSFSTGTATVQMLFDNTPGARPMPNKNVWLNKGGTGYLGYTSLVGLVIAYTITDVKPGSNTDNPASTMFDFDLTITACTFTITGP